MTQYDVAVSFGDLSGGDASLYSATVLSLLSTSIHLVLTTRNSSLSLQPDLALSMLGLTKSKSTGQEAVKHIETADHQESRSGKVLQEHDAWHKLGWSWPTWRKWQILCSRCYAPNRCPSQPAEPFISCDVYDSNQHQSQVSISNS